MATGNRFTLYACDVVNGGALADVWIDQIVNQSYAAAVAEILKHAGGTVNPSFVASAEQRPTISLTTTAVATVLTGIGMQGLKVAGDEDEAGAVFYWQKMDPQGTRASSGHASLTMKNGIIVPRRLRASQGREAELDVEAVAIYDDTTEPFVVSVAATLAATANVVDELFTIGPVTLSTGAVVDPTEITLEFGIQLLTDPTEGVVWPRFVAVQTAQPEIRVRCRNVEQVNIVDIEGEALTSGSFYLRQFAKGGQLEANNAAKHVKISWYTGQAVVESLAGEYPTEAEVRIRPTYDGTHAVLTYAAGQQIS